MTVNGLILSCTIDSARMRPGLKCLIIWMFSSLFISCGTWDDAIETDLTLYDENSGKTITQEVWDSSLFLTKEGRRQAIVHFGHMVQYEEDENAYFDDSVRVDFYDQQGNHSSKLTAERGKYNTKTEDVIGMGNVIVVSDSGDTLNTQRLRWDHRIEKIICDTTFVYKQPRHGTYWGKGFESNADLSERRYFNLIGRTNQHIDLEQAEKSVSKSGSPDEESLNTRINGEP